MNNAAVAIGVNRTGGLTPLTGAVPGAEKFAQWATAQGMDTTLLTDKRSKVRLADVLDVIQPIVESQTCEKLVVFFAGHGYLLAPTSELWLLSDAPDRPAEAINVQLSRDGARYCGIPHVIFVSDACRSGGSSHRHRSVQGGSAFPTPLSFDQDGEVDTFYATRPGDPALEFRDDAGANANYKGVFTECLLEALQGPDPSLVTESAEGGISSWLIPSRPLKEHLRDAVPRRASEISIALTQEPEVRVESALPRFFGKLDAPPSPRAPRPPHGAAALGGVGIDVNLRGVVEETQEVAMSFSDEGRLDVAVDTEAGRRFTKQVEQLADSPGRASFETACGFTVYGQVQSVTLGQGPTFELWQEGEFAHVRIAGAGEHIGTSILIEFDDGSGTVVAVKPEFIGTVIREKGRVVNVSYTPSESSDLFRDEEYAEQRGRIERRRAFAAAASRQGVFDVSGGDAADAAYYLRMLKRMDPTLGIYAAYAYHEAGRIRQVRDVLRYMTNDPLPVPLDVALLARQADWPSIAPFCPMLTQGWALLSFDSRLQTLERLRSALVPALWTTFAPPGVDRVRGMLTEGVVK